jgi:hypothetical protein
MLPESVVAAVDANKPVETVVLLDAKGKLLPVSTFAFKISRGPKRRVEQLYEDSLIIYRNGAVKKIDRIDFLGYWGTSIAQKLLSAANGGIRRISLHLVDQPQVTLDGIKDILRRALPEDRKLVEPFFNARDPLPDVLRGVNQAMSCEQIFDALRMPSPEDALDILC